MVPSLLRAGERYAPSRRQGVGRLGDQKEKRRMASSVIGAEHELQARLRRSARGELGPAARECDVNALADEAYWGDGPNSGEQESEADRQDRERRRRTTIATMERRGL